MGVTNIAPVGNTSNIAPLKANSNISAESAIKDIRASYGLDKDSKALDNWAPEYVNLPQGASRDMKMPYKRVMVLLKGLYVLGLTDNPSPRKTEQATRNALTEAVLVHQVNHSIKGGKLGNFIGRDTVKTLLSDLDAKIK